MALCERSRPDPRSHLDADGLAAQLRRELGAPRPAPGRAPPSALRPASTAADRRITLLSSCLPGVRRRHCGNFWERSGGRRGREGGAAAAKPAAAGPWRRSSGALSAGNEIRRRWGRSCCRQSPGGAPAAASSSEVMGVRGKERPEEIWGRGASGRTRTSSGDGWVPWWWWRRREALTTTTVDDDG